MNRRIRYRYAAILFCLIVCSSRTPVTRPGETFDAGAIFVSTEPVFTHQFQVTNTTDRPVRVLNDSRSCACTTVEYEKRVLQPGESMPLTMKVRLIPAYTSQDATCVLQTDHPSHGEWHFRIRLENYPAIVMIPPDLNLGRCGAASESKPCEYGEAWVTSFSSPNREPTVRGVSFGRELDVKLDMTPIVDTLRDGVVRRRYRLIARPASMPSPEPGSHSAAAVVAFEDGSQAVLNVHWLINSAIRAIPSTLHFGNDARGIKQTSKSILIQSSDGQPFRPMTT